MSLLLLAVAMALGNLERFFYPSVIDNFKGLAEVPMFLSRHETPTPLMMVPMAIFMSKHNNHSDIHSS
jgi:hypothetical protein